MIRYVYIACMYIFSYIFRNIVWRALHLIVLSKISHCKGTDLGNSYAYVCGKAVPWSLL